MTSNVSLNYTPLEPLEIEKEPCPYYCKVARVAALMFVGITFGVAIGVAIAMAFEVSVLVAGIVGAVVGLIIGLVAGFFQRVDPPIVKYRVQTLEQLEKTQTHPRVLAALQDLKSIFSAVDFSPKYDYQYHSLHDRLTLVTDKMRNEREDIKKVWNVFLENIQSHPFKVSFPSGIELELDCTTELNRLDGTKLLYDVVRLDNPTKDDLKRLLELRHQCLGYEPSNTKVFDNKERLYVARDRESHEIIGYLKTMIEEEDPDAHEIAELAREPSAARLGIGEKLMEAALRDYPEEEFYLQVRESNESAIQLYQSFGFAVEDTEEEYYTNPTEDAKIMRRPANVVINIA